MNLDDLLSSGRPAEESPGSPICSRKACTAPAVWALAWNNPKVHDPERRKNWTACSEHRQYLSDFLAARGFLRDVTSLE